MKKAIIGLGVVVMLASCGAQNDPIRPTANLGLSIGSGGVTPSANVSAQSGPLTVSLGL